MNAAMKAAMTGRWRLDTLIADSVHRRQINHRGSLDNGRRARGDECPTRDQHVGHEREDHLKGSEPPQQARRTGAAKADWRIPSRRTAGKYPGGQCLNTSCSASVAHSLRASAACASAALAGLQHAADLRRAGPAMQCGRTGVKRGRRAPAHPCCQSNALTYAISMLPHGYEEFEPAAQPHDRGYDTAQFVTVDAAILSVRGGELQSSFRPIARQAWP